jgi:multiple sugar transport system permease protein
MAAFISKLLPRRLYRFQLYLLLAPFLLGSLVLTILPALATVTVSFMDYNTVGPPAWVGFENFGRLIRSDYVRISLWNTLIFIALAVPLRLFAALGLALLLQRRGPLFGLYRAAVYLPTIIPEVAYALIWLWIFNPLFGPLNLALSWLGLPAPAWLAEPATARLAIVIMLTFQIGEGFIVLLAGLQNIPRSFFEAARVDGASAWQVFARITLPLIAPWLFLLTFRDLIMSLQNTFTPSFVLTYGGPYYATTFAPLLLYEIAFDFFDFGLAAALLVVVYLLMAIFVMSILNIVQARGTLDV